MFLENMAPLHSCQNITVARQLVCVAISNDYRTFSFFVQLMLTFFPPSNYTVSLLTFQTQVVCFFVLFFQAILMSKMRKMCIFKCSVVRV